MLEPSDGNDDDEEEEEGARQTRLIRISLTGDSWVAGGQDLKRKWHKAVDLHWAAKHRVHLSVMLEMQLHVFNDM